MKPGERGYWTPAREKALLKLGEKAQREGKYRDWEYARERLPKQSEILKDRTNEQLRKTYSIIVKSSQGLCVYAKCKLPALEGQRYCGKHRKLQAQKAKKYLHEKKMKQ